MTTEETAMGGKGCTSLDKMPTEVTERESVAKEKFTKPLFIWVEQGHEGGASLLLCLS